MISNFSFKAKLSSLQKPVRTTSNGLFVHLFIPVYWCVSVINSFETVFAAKNNRI